MEAPNCKVGVLYFYIVERSVIVLILKDRDDKPRCEIVDPERDLLMRASESSLYLATAIQSGADSDIPPRKMILRIAADRMQNGIIHSEAQEICRMNIRSDEIEKIVRAKGRPPVHYDWLIPQIEASFIADESQENRQVSLMTFADMAADELFPVPKVVDYCMIDCQTAAWMLGRFLKLQTFMDLMEVGFEINPELCLISPQKHRLIFLGLANEYFRCGGSFAPGSACEAGQNIRTAAGYLMEWIEPEQLRQEAKFHALLQELCTKAPDDGATAHGKLYGWIEENWGIKYHPFTYFAKATQEWKHSDNPIF